MKTLQEMSLEALNIELLDRQASAFYSECLFPKTPKDEKNNKDLVDWINEVKIEIDKR